LLDLVRCAPAVNQIEPQPLEESSSCFREQIKRLDLQVLGMRVDRREKMPRNATPPVLGSYGKGAQERDRTEYLQPDNANYFGFMPRQNEISQMRLYVLSGKTALREQSSDRCGIPRRGSRVASGSGNVT
jgi:hypothetical protein